VNSQKIWQRASNAHAVMLPPGVDPEDLTGGAKKSGYTCFSFRLRNFE